jgi:pimeloyl-ACP methyl ester carboxylesterase
MVHADPLLVLVHSPFLGPSAWEWVARELERRERAAIVPALRGVADEPYRPWRDVSDAVDAVAAHGARTVVLVGHSGAGSLLPAIAESFSGRVAAIAFVDAFLPPASGTARLVPVEFVEELSALATDDVLPPWSSWFGEEVMRDLVPDGPRRARVERDMPRLPLSVLQAELPVPDGWDRRPCAYLLLSAEPYAPSAADARARGWPTAEVTGGKHLDLVRRPGTVATALLELERAMLGQRRAGPPHD